MSLKDYLVFILILGNTFINLISVTGGNFYLIITTIIFFAFFSKTSSIYKLHSAIKLYGFITLFAFFGLFYAISTNLVFDDLAKMISNLLSMIIVWQYLQETGNIVKLLKMIVISVSILAVPNAIFASQGIREMFWGGVNPVAVMMFFSVISIFILLHLKVRWVLFLLPLNLYVIFLTQSQKIILSLLLGVILFLVINFFRKKFYDNIKILILILFVTAIGTIILTNDIFSDSLIRTTATIQQLQTNEQVEGSAVGSGYRTLLLEKGWLYFQESPFLGYGLNNSREVYLDDIGKPTYSHNTWIEMLLSFGFFITVLYFIIFFNVINIVIRKYLKQVDDLFNILLCALLMIILIGQFQKMYYNIFTHMFLLICIFFVNNEKKLWLQY